MDAARDSGQYNNDNITNLGYGVAIAGTAPGGEIYATATIYDNGVFVDSVPVSDSTGIFASSKIDLTSEGLHNLTARITDAAGNVSAPSPILTINIDFSTPVPTFNDVTADNTISNPEKGLAAISGWAEPLSSVRLQATGLDVSIFSDINGSWSYTPSPAQVDAFGDGPEDISVTVTDLAGNTNAGTKTFEVDLTPPPIVTPPGNWLFAGEHGHGWYVFDTNGNGTIEHYGDIVSHDWLESTFGFSNDGSVNTVNRFGKTWHLPTQDEAASFGGQFPGIGIASAWTSELVPGYTNVHYLGGWNTHGFSSPAGTAFAQNDANPSSFALLEVWW